MSGTPVTIHQLTDLGSGIADPDTFPVWDLSGSVTRKVSRVNLVGASITGGGTIDLGGRTLTVPATGTAALINTVNVFTANQAISAVGASFTLNPNDNTNSIGTRIVLGRNNNASTPAAGHVRMENLSGSAYHTWPDATGNLRIGTGLPTNAADTSGTVVGAQTSHETTKTIEGEPPALDQVYGALAAAAEHVAHFVYTVELEAYGESAERYDGLVLKEEAPATWRYGTDKREQGYRAGKSLNTITLLGDLLRVAVDLAERLAALESGSAVPAGD